MGVIWLWHMFITCFRIVWYLFGVKIQIKFKTGTEDQNLLTGISSEKAAWGSPECSFHKHSMPLQRHSSSFFSSTEKNALILQVLVCSAHTYCVKKSTTAGSSQGGGNGTAIVPLDCGASSLKNEHVQCYFTSPKAFSSLFFTPPCPHFRGDAINKCLLCSMELSLPTSTLKISAFLFTNTFLSSDPCPPALFIFKIFHTFCCCTL